MLGPDPIQLVSWDHLAQLCRRPCGKSRDWALLKADHEAAYEQLPLRPQDQSRAIIALKHPVTGKWFGFGSHTLVFGATAAVLHYNVFSRLINALANRLLGIPSIFFFDDFSALAPRLLANKAMGFFSILRDPRHYHQSWKIRSLHWGGARRQRIATRCIFPSRGQRGKHVRHSGRLHRSEFHFSPRIGEIKWPAIICPDTPLRQICANATSANLSETAQTGI